jgi:hypothetical protein
LKSAAMLMGAYAIAVPKTLSQRKMDESEAPVKARRRPERGYGEQHVRSERGIKSSVGEGCGSEKLRKSVDLNLV